MFQNESTSILEINFRRLLLACESRNREILRQNQLSIKLKEQQEGETKGTPNAVSTAATNAIDGNIARPHALPVLQCQIEALDSMLTELQSRSRERSLNLQKNIQHTMSSSSAANNINNTSISLNEENNINNQIENIKQLSKRASIILEQWKMHAAELERAMLNNGTGVDTSHKIRSATNSPAPATFTEPNDSKKKKREIESPVLVKFRGAVSTSHQAKQPRIQPVASSLSSTTTKSIKTKKIIHPQKKRKKKVAFKKELRSWQKTLGLLDGAPDEPSKLTGDEERRRLEEQTEKSLEEILETTATLKGVVQQSNVKIQNDLERIDQTSKMVDKNQHAVEKNISKTKEQSKALWGDMFTEIKMALAAIVMTLIIVLITRVPFINLFFMKKF
jgi:hypothetical protein